MANETKIKLRSVKLLKSKKNEPEHLEVAHTEIFADNSHATGGKEYDRPPHPDLKNALSNLRVHLAILTDYITEKQAKSEEAISRFSVTGFSISDNGDGFVIKGYMTGRYGVVPINTPFIRYEAPEKNGYILLDDAVDKLDILEGEVMKYLSGEKRGGQQTLDLPENNKEKENELEEAEA